MIAQAHPLSPDILEAFKVANNWREAHAYPMRSVRCQLMWYMQRLSLEGVTGARLKRMQAIRRKLGRSGIHLDKLQDLGGCRAILPRIADVKTLVDALRQKSRHELRTESDYIAKPKLDGYRSHHLGSITAVGGRQKYTASAVSRCKFEAVCSIRGRQLSRRSACCAANTSRGIRAVQIGSGCSNSCPPNLRTLRDAQDRQTCRHSVSASPKSKRSIDRLKRQTPWKI